MYGRYTRGGRRLGFWPWWGALVGAVAITKANRAAGRAKASGYNGYTRRGRIVHVLWWLIVAMPVTLAVTTGALWLDAYLIRLWPAGGLLMALVILATEVLVLWEMAVG